MKEEVQAQARKLIEELIDKAQLKSGMTVVVGCSTSEIMGERIGTDSQPEIGKAVFDAIHQSLDQAGIYLATQCCEHLNRAIVTEREARPFAPTVNVVPQPKAGGSFSTAAYQAFHDPIVIEEIQADAGIDIGNTLIGMHLKPVAVPLRLENHRIGSAWVNAARTRPKFIGGERAHYNDQLK
ncbi:MULTISPECIES: TIGR01440 family protein [Aerococcus]|uniref:TIGR01440 family protein n=1 Tax=Aerococcus TaxID=1375 RepID=UPI000DCC00E9|nr:MULTISPECIES: TIGR01440 family protein [Aerococcus]KAA9234487.1 TIGR01440 family protein [Aerococcus mictus]MDK6291682.1 TIGR01440 family protein [Aerococcus urinae]MDK6374424.1 TIGR01440 family protein [Aerococcus urinae]MDK6421271.1 TIGR01440 family protein [Aerococcus urinae]MDK8075060.1 TIGR01440 family protein [Aerococcus urinae]